MPRDPYEAELARVTFGELEPVLRKIEIHGSTARRRLQVNGGTWRPPNPLGKRLGRCRGRDSNPHAPLGDTRF
jgi:hypothetical protein